MIDYDLLEFVSSAEIDKIVDQGDISIVNSGPFGTSYAGSDRIVQIDTPNHYGKPCLVRFRWSIDGNPFNSPETMLSYAFTVDATAWGGPVSDPLPGVVAACAVGVNAGGVLFRTVNGHHTNVAYTGTAMSPGPDNFSPISHTFRIQYVLLELD